MSPHNRLPSLNIKLRVRTSDKQRDYTQLLEPRHTDKRRHVPVRNQGLDISARSHHLYSSDEVETAWESCLNQVLDGYDIGHAEEIFAV